MRQLEVFSAYGHSIKSVRNNFVFAFRVSWPWMLLLLPFNIAEHIYFLFHPVVDPKAFDPQILAITIAYGLVASIGFASIAVMWHRYILLDEIPMGWARLRLDSIVFRYFGNSILIFLICALAGAAFGIFFAIMKLVFGSFSAIILVPATIAFMLALVVYTIALGIKLPSVAIDRRYYTFGQVLQASKGNFWRFLGLVGLMFLTLIAAAIALGLVTYVLALSGSQPIIFVSIAVQLFVNWVATIWNVTILTSLYGFFIEDRSF